MTGNKGTPERRHREKELCELRAKALAKNQVQKFEDLSSHSKDSGEKLAFDRAGEKGTADSRDENFNWDFALVAAGSSVSGDSTDFNGPVIYTYHNRKKNALSPTSTVSSFTATDFESMHSKPDEEREQPSIHVRDMAKNVPVQLLQITEESFEEEIIFESSVASPRSRQSAKQSNLTVVPPRSRKSKSDLSPTTEESRFVFEDVNLSNSKNRPSPLKLLSPPRGGTKGKETSADEKSGHPSFFQKLFGRCVFGSKAGTDTDDDSEHPRQRESHVAVAIGNDDSANGSDPATFKVVESRSMMIILIMLVVLVGVAGAALLIVVAPKQEDPMSAADHSYPADLHETRLTSLKGVAASISGTEKLENTTTPQSKALEWLSNKDEASLSLQDTPYSVLVERYIIAVLYFSTTGGGWSEQRSFLSVGSVCDWYDSISSDETDPHGIVCDDQFNVQKIGLPDNNLEGEIPREIVSLKALEVLDLSGNDIIGEIPTQIGLLSSLKVVSLQSNRIEGQVPEEIGRLTQLQILDLSSNKLTGSVPSKVGNLVQLEELSLGNNELQGTLPNSIELMTRLVVLNVFRNQLEGTIPKMIGELPHLITLNLASNKFIDDLDDAFCPADSAYDAFWSDCRGEDALVECSCCTICCEGNGNTLDC